MSSRHTGDAIVSRSCGLSGNIGLHSFLGMHGSSKCHRLHGINGVALTDCIDSMQAMGPMHSLDTMGSIESHGFKEFIGSINDIESNDSMEIKDPSGATEFMDSTHSTVTKTPLNPWIP